MTRIGMKQIEYYSKYNSNKKKLISYCSITKILIRNKMCCYYPFTEIVALHLKTSAINTIIASNTP